MVKKRIKPDNEKILDGPASVVPVTADTVGGRLSDKAYNYVVNQIASKKFKPLDRITESQIAKTLNISHIPVREAIERLDRDGLLQKIPRKGARVRKIECDEIVMFFQIREIIELASVEYLSENRTEFQLCELKKVLGLLEKASDQNDVEAYETYESYFHLTLVQFMGNPKLSAYFESIYTLIRASSPVFQLSVYSSALNNGRKLEHKKPANHTAIFDAIVKKDKKMAKMITQAHICYGLELYKAVDNLVDTIKKENVQSLAK